MRLKNFLLVVKDIDKARAFYEEMFGLRVIRDFDGNMILTDGLVLQQADIWEKFIGREITERSNNCELYFETDDVAAFAEKLREKYPETVFVNELMTHSWGQQVVRFYDLDGNLIEVGSVFEG